MALSEADRERIREEEEERARVRRELSWHGGGGRYLGCGPMVWVALVLTVLLVVANCTGTLGPVLKQFGLGSE